MNPLDRPTVRNVLLPSGKTIEVVYFEGAPSVAAPSTATPQQEADGLHLCAQCGSATVQPLDWQEAGPHHWEISLRCPNCLHTETGVFAQELVERLEDVLDDATEALVRDLRRLTHANMEEEIARFTEALAADLILPMDF